MKPLLKLPVTQRTFPNSKITFVLTPEGQLKRYQIKNIKGLKERIKRRRRQLYNEGNRGNHRHFFKEKEQDC